MYQVLARKYRPRNFTQLVGQTHVAKALTSALERGRLHHAYLFTGTRGVGKTTIARILAKCLNCETGVTATPCETCAVCTSVNEGRFIDLIEIDAASRTGVDDTRELLNNVPYAPTQGRYKVYLIDEVHMFSNSSFNALLKTLEEPPEHVKFLFATTDPQKLPITVISRCLQFTLRPLAKDEIYQHLDNVLMAESIPHEAEALWQLAESAQGSVRDALSLTDQAIAYGEGQVLANDVKDMLGLIDKGLVLDLILNIHQNRRQDVAQLLTSMRQQALDVTHILEQMIAALHDMALLQCLAVVAQDQESFEQRKAQISQLISPQDLQLYYQIAIQGRADLPLALTPEQGFEMCVMRLLAFRPLSPQEVTLQAVQTQNNDVVEQIETPQIQQHIDSQDLSAQQNEIVQKRVQVEQGAQETIVQNEVLQEIPTEIVHQVGMQIMDQQADAQSNMFEHQVDEPIVENYSHPNNEEEIQSPPVNIDQTTLFDQPIEQEITVPKVEPIEQEITVGNTALLLEEDQSTALQQENPEQKTQDEIPDDPRQLLQPSEQELTGQWTLEKWDYWLRLDQISPAMKEIAQHGVMQGNISGESVLLLDPSYERMFEPFIVEVEKALQTMHPQFHLRVNYQQVQQKNPFMLQQQRKHQAYQAAQKKIEQHPTIQELQQEFSASIEEFQLKS